MEANSVPKRKHGNHDGFFVAFFSTFSEQKFCTFFSLNRRNSLDFDVFL